MLQELTVAHLRFPEGRMGSSRAGSAERTALYGQSVKAVVYEIGTNAY
jgi:hypothetical protein